MAKFIELTDIRRGPIAINMDTVEVMAPITAGGTEVISITHHTKYIVKESMDDILRIIRKYDYFGYFTCNVATETPSIMEEENS